MSTGQAIGRGVFGVMALLFVYAAVVQWNDPDPVVWIAMYAMAAAVCALFAAGRPVPTWLVAATGVVATAWSLWLASIVFGGGELHQMFPEEEATGTVIVDAEEGREMGGLAIVAVTLWSLTAVQWRSRRAG